MPLTAKGQEMLENFQEQYGKRGKVVFYAYMNKYPKKTRSWHK